MTTYWVVVFNLFQALAGSLSEGSISSLVNLRDNIKQQVCDIQEKTLLIPLWNKNYEIIVILITITATTTTTTRTILITLSIWNFLVSVWFCNNMMSSLETVNRTVRIGHHDNSNKNDFPFFERMHIPISQKGHSSDKKISIDTNLLRQSFKMLPCILTTKLLTKR